MEAACGRRRFRPKFSAYLSDVQQQEDQFAQTHGCLPVKSRLKNKLPLGLDILKMQYDVLPSQKLLAFQSQLLKRLDATFSIHLFGGTGYVTTDPRNAEAVCCSRFQGKWSYQMAS